MRYEVNPKFVRLLQQAAEVYLSSVSDEVLVDQSSVTGLTASAFQHVAPLVSCILGPVVFLGPSQAMWNGLLDELFRQMREDINERCKLASTAADLSVGLKRGMPEC